MSDQEDRSGASVGASCSAIAGPVGVSAGGSTANGGSAEMSASVGNAEATVNFSGEGVQGGTSLSTGGSFYAGPGWGVKQSINSDGTADTTVSAGFGAKIEVNRF